MRNHYVTPSAEQLASPFEDPHSPEALGRAQAQAAREAQAEIAAAEQARADAAEAERLRQIDEQAERRRGHLENANRQATLVTWAARLQDPTLPASPEIQLKIAKELEAMEEISVGSISAAYENLFARGEIKRDYSRAARAKVIAEAEQMRQQGVEIPWEFEKSPSEMSEDEIRAFMKATQPVRIETLRKLSESLDRYSEFKQKKDKPGVGTPGSLAWRASKL